MTTTASTAVIRQWARAEGFNVGERGRLSPDVLAAYHSQEGEVPSPAVEAAAAPNRARRDQRVKQGGQLRIGARPAPGASGVGRRIRARAS